MDNRTIYVFLIIAFTTITIDVVVAVKAIGKKNKLGLLLGHTILYAAIVCMTYSMSVLSIKYKAFSIWSSLYFISIDWMLVYLLAFVMHFTHLRRSHLRRCKMVVYSYALFETIMFIINIFHPIVIDYLPSISDYVYFVYTMKPLYIAHLVFTYMIVAVSIYILIRKAFGIPRMYRKKYIYILSAILIVIGINAIFLYYPGQTVLSKLDCSVFIYSIAILIIYWFTFMYSKHTMLEGLSMNVFNNLEQSIILFDYDGRMVLRNIKAVETFSPYMNMDDEISLENFLGTMDINIDSVSGGDDCSVQCYINRGAHNSPIRCDYTCRRDSKKRAISYLLIFTDLEMETDLLTGFHNWDYFSHYASRNKDMFESPIGVVAFDINNLAIINSSYGREAGDARICEMADCMRANFADRTYFVRKEAILIALCFNPDRSAIKKAAEEVVSQFEGHSQYAMAITSYVENVQDGIDEATKTLRTKKLLDRDSARSQTLTSLVRALQESDEDTEEHVQRTQKLGSELGKRIGLSDSMQSDLSLLCLLHDIGKIGIPLEILNKPGRLNADEWRVLKSHTEKGYQIAMSSREFSHIADEILHHHERWDGKGYPSGLSRESIPLLSRIISVVDAYDAMTNNRPYRQGMPIMDALEELKASAGTQFDPHITSQFIEMVNENLDEFKSLSRSEGEADAAIEVTETTKSNETTEADGLIKSTDSSEASGTIDSTKTSGRSTTNDTSTVNSKIRSAGIDVEEQFNSHVILHSKYIMDEQDIIVDADGNFEAITGYTREDIENRIVSQELLIPEEDRYAYFIMVEEETAKHGLALIEHRIRTKSGDDIYVMCYGRRYYDSAVKSGRAEIIISKITDTYAMKSIVEIENIKALRRLEQWEETFRKDSLTGLLTHLAFQNDVDQKLLKTDAKILFLMIDVDKFKMYNDTYGHRAGDEYLILVANTITQALRNNDMACRMGGDEFACALAFKPEHSDEFMFSRAKQIYDKIDKLLSQEPTYTSISMGATVSAPGRDTFVKLYQSADENLYLSKARGRGVLSTDMDNTSKPTENS